jgi:hypothetical protein
VTDSSSPTPSARPGSTDQVNLWQNTLATEHAVIWSYGLIGATDNLADAADAELQVHRARRNDCIAAVADLGADPVASAAAYDVKKPSGEPAARRLAANLESDATAVYAALAGSSDRRARLVAAQWLRGSAIAQTRWNDAVPALPGFEDSQFEGSQAAPSS